MHTQHSLTNAADDSAAPCAAQAERAPAVAAPTPAGASPAGSPQTPAAGTPLAQLLLHAGDSAAAGAGARPSVLSRTRALAQAACAPWPPPPSHLRVANIHGRQFFCADTLAADVSVPLPAGTYHVSFSLGGQQRRYTVALEPGAAFNLHLRAPASPR